MDTQHVCFGFIMVYHRSKIGNVSSMFHTQWLFLVGKCNPFYDGMNHPVFRLSLVPVLRLHMLIYFVTVCDSLCVFFIVFHIHQYSPYRYIMIYSPYRDIKKNLFTNISCSFKKTYTLAFFFVHDESTRVRYSAIFLH